MENRRAQAGERGIVRAMAATLSLLVVIGSTGCVSLFGARALELPADFQTRPVAARLLGATTRLDAYREIFPRLTYLKLSGQLDARGSWWQGSQHFALAYFALTPPDALPEHQSLRMTGSSPAGTLLDLTVNRGVMSVAVYLKGGGAFEGPIPPEGSPIMRHFGVEPWELGPIFTLGQRLATGEMKPARNAGRGETTLVPVASVTPDGLASVELDARSGLPREALWRRGNLEWRVSYLGWKDFTDDPTDLEPSPRPPRTRLMPSGVVVERASPHTKLTLHVNSYMFGDYVPAGAFQPRLPRTLPRLPLEKLNEVLE